MDRWERNMVSYQEVFTAFRGGPLAKFSQDSPTQPAPPPGKRRRLPQGSGATLPPIDGYGKHRPREKLLPIGGTP